jgi:hypothetical protein
MKALAFNALVLLLCLTAAGFAENQGAILPKTFAGWQVQGSPKTSTEARVADAANGPVLKEYGFHNFEAATYRRDDGRKLAVKAAQFADVSGAFGAYTFYYQPEMVREQIGDQAASFNQRILFYRGNILVDAVFDRVTAMSAAELRELAGLLPKPIGSAANPPSVLAYLPRKGYLKNTEKYVTGPLALAQAGSPIPASLVDFASGAEVVMGKYSAPGGDATLMVLNYPTPQIAAEHMRRLDATRPQQPSAGNAGTTEVPPFFDKRTGPLLAVATGPLTENDARALLGAVNYDADVTWNENTLLDKKNNLANLLVNIIILCGILIGLGLVAGVAFGGLRVALQRLLPGRHLEGAEEVDFISLHLEEGSGRTTDPQLSSTIKAS